MNWKKILSGLLLVFVMVTIGFALGKEVTLRRIQNREGGETPVPTPTGTGEKPSTTDTAASKDHVIVYYFHGDIRCPTCKTIESQTHDTVQSDFAAQLDNGQ